MQSIWVVKQCGCNANASSLPTQTRKDTLYRRYDVSFSFISQDMLIVFLLSKINIQKNTHKGVFLYGVPRGIRTPDLLVRSQSLYPAELQAHLFAT